MSLAADHLPPRPRIKRKAEPFTCQESGGAFATIVAELYKKGRITPRQARAAQMFLNDLTAYHGSTGMGGYQERVDTSARPGKLSGWSQAHINAQAILDKLWFHERKTLGYLITRKEKARGSLADFGREVFGYSDQAMAVASAVAKIGGLLDSIAEHYLGVDAAIESLGQHHN
jgi:hypothetical protein